MSKFLNNLTFLVFGILWQPNKMQSYYFFLKQCYPQVYFFLLPMKIEACLI